jgi:hypothetical protein
MRKFSPAQAIVIRERLIRYLVDQKRLGPINADPQGRPIRSSNRTVLEDIIFSEYTSYEEPTEDDYVDDKPYDYFFELKDDSLGAFLARRQDGLQDRHLNEVMNFLVGKGCLTEQHISEIFAIESLEIPIKLTRPQEDHLDRLPILGEYVAFADGISPIELRTCIFARIPRTKTVRTIHLDIKFPRLTANDNKASIKKEYEELSVAEIFSGSGICVVPEFGDTHILVRMKAGDLVCLKISVSRDRHSFDELTRGGCHFEVIERLDKDVSKAVTDINNQFGLSKNRSFTHGRSNSIHNFRPDNLIKFHLLPYFNEKQTNINTGEEIQQYWATLKLLDINWDREFIEACETLDFPSIVQALIFGANPFTKSQPTGNTILHWAAIHGSIDLYFLLNGSAIRTEEGFDIASFLNNFADEVLLPDEIKLQNLYFGFETLVFERNSNNQLASSCIANVRLSGETSEDREIREFFLTVLSWEFKLSTKSSKEYIDWLIELARGEIVFPNIIR